MVLFESVSRECTLEEGGVNKRVEVCLVSLKEEGGLHGCDSCSLSKLKGREPDEDRTEEIREGGESEKKKKKERKRPASLTPPRLFGTRRQQKHNVIKMEVAALAASWFSAFLWGFQWLSNNSRVKMWTGDLKIPRTGLD